MYNNKFLIYCMLVFMVFAIVSPASTASAASVDSVLSTLASSTAATQTGASDGNFLSNIFDLLFNKILGPLFSVLGGTNSTTPTNGNSPVIVTPLPPASSGGGSVSDSGVLRGKVIVVDPGHGGSNPGAVANNDREADNNLAVGLKLRDKLTKAGAKVLITRDTDRTVAAEGSSLSQELQARVDMAEQNHADMFVSVHTNENPDSSITGAMTFYPSGRSQSLAQEVQSSLIAQTGAADKGTSTATFYVLRNTTMPSILVEMGFISNADEAALMKSDSYRDKVAQGIFNGIVRYYNNQ